MSLIKSLSAALRPGAGSDAQPALNPEMAAAVLLIAMERADFENDEAERAVIERLLARHFSLSPGELEALLSEAEAETGEAISFYDYVEKLNNSLDIHGKRDILRMLWHVAYADGRLDPFEEQLMRRLADMLYLTHKDFVRLKLEVLGELQSV